MRPTALFLVLLVSLSAVACGHPTTTERPTAASLTVTPVVARGGIASGAAVGTTPGLARPAPPPVVPATDSIPAVEGDCTATHPVKVGRDDRAYEPSRADYSAVQGIQCYTTLAAAAANGYQPADANPGGP